MGWVSVFLLIGIHTLTAQAQTFYSLELGAAYQSLNDQRVPGEGGTKFSLTDFGKGPFPSFRVYLGHRWDKHELRVLYAPFALRLDGQLDQATIFKNTNFQPNLDTDFYYQFNSYRLTYSYELESSSDWKTRIGFSAKIRDAEVKVSQGAISESKKNVGFVPLLNYQAVRSLSEQYLFRFDIDALGAPQGRAIDMGLFIEKALKDKNSSLFLGYRTVEGGADNDTVYNFAWVHFLTFGVRGEF